MVKPLGSKTTRLLRSTSKAVRTVKKSNKPNSLPDLNKKARTARASAYKAKKKVQGLTKRNPIKTTMAVNSTIAAAGYGYRKHKEKQAEQQTVKGRIKKALK